MERLIDLHTHTNESDGDYSPLDLLRIARQRGVSVISITDHDTVDGYNDALFDKAEELGIRLIPGIELSTTDDLTGEKVHVLGLFIDPYNITLKGLCLELRQARINIMNQVGDKLQEHNIVLRTDDLIRTGEIITKAHIARDVIENEVNASVLESYHGHIPLQGEFIEQWLIEGCPAFVQRDQPLPTHHAIQAIHNAGGIASCAHPSFNVMRGLKLAEMFDLIVRNKFDAVEAINVQYDKTNGDKRFEMVREFSDFAKEEGLLISGGSDFHSNNRALWGAYSALGLANEPFKMDENLLSELEERSKDYSPVR